MNHINLGVVAQVVIAAHYIDCMEAVQILAPYRTLSEISVEV